MVWYDISAGDRVVVCTWHLPIVTATDALQQGECEHHAKVCFSGNANMKSMAKQACSQRSIDMDLGPLNEVGWLVDCTEADPCAL